MGKTKKHHLFILGLIIILSHSLFGQTVTLKPQSSAPSPQSSVLTPQQEQEARQLWFEKSRLYIGVREKTNRNDHDSIYVFNRFAGVAKNSPYCAAGLNYTAHLAGLNFKIKYPAAVRYWFTKESIIWSRTAKKWLAPAQFMDSIWIFGSHIEALAQPTLPRDIEDGDRFLTIAFNTGGNTGRQGVHYPITRRWRDVRHVGNPFKLL